MLHRTAALALASLGALACSNSPSTTPQEKQEKIDAAASAATDTPAKQATATPSSSLEVASDEGLPLFGLRTRSRELYIRSTDVGPRYTVKSLDGDVLASSIDDAELQRRFPELHALASRGVDGLIDASGVDY